MTPFVWLPLLSFACVSLVMIIVYFWALKIKNYGVVDIFWAFNFLIIAIIIWLLATGGAPRKKYRIHPYCFYGVCDWVCIY